MPREPLSGRAGETPSSAFVQQVLVVVGIVALVLFFWQIRNAFLLAFAGVVVAALLFAAAEPIRRFTPLSQKWSLVLAGLLIVVALAATFVLIGNQVATQINVAFNQLPEALDTLERRFGVTLPSPDRLKEQISDKKQSEPGPVALSGQLLTYVASWGAVVLEVITSFILVVIAGVFFAADPETYRKGFVQLFTPAQHERVSETLIVCGRSLRLWLVAQLIAMAIVGVLVGLGAWLIGLPAPLALGLFAALTEFVPVIGPIIGAAPAIVFAATQGTTALIWTIVLFLAIQQLESNVITPLVERRVVSIPPALFLFAVLAFGLLFGALGLVLAAPLTVVAFVAVKKLYVRDTLGEKTVVPGEKN